MIKFYGDYEIYSESGVDLTLLRENLKRTPSERLLRNSQGIKLVRALDAARQTGQAGRRQPLGPNMELEVETLLRQLLSQRVDFVLIGGLAMRFHGSAHITQDLDICYRRTPENISAVAAAFASLHPYLRGAPPGFPFRFDAQTILAGLNFTLATDLGDIDLLGEVAGIGGFDAVLAQSEERTVFGLAIHVLSLDGLIAAKRAAGRNKDRVHLLELEELKKMRDLSS